MSWFGQVWLLLLIILTLVSQSDAQLLEETQSVGSSRELHCLFGVLVASCLWLWVWRSSWIATCAEREANTRHTAYLDGMRESLVVSERRETLLLDFLIPRQNPQRWCTCGALLGCEPVQMRRVLDAPFCSGATVFRSGVYGHDIEEGDFLDCLNEDDIAPPGEDIVYVPDDETGDTASVPYATSIGIGVVVLLFWSGVGLGRLVSYILCSSQVKRGCVKVSVRGVPVNADSKAPLGQVRPAPCKRARPPAEIVPVPTTATATAATASAPVLAVVTEDVVYSPPPGLDDAFFGQEGMFFADCADEGWLDVLNEGPMRRYHFKKTVAAAAASAGTAAAAAAAATSLFGAPGDNKGFAFSPVLEC